MNLRSIAIVTKRLAAPLVQPGKLVTGLPKYLQYIQDWRQYARMPGAERLQIFDAVPCVGDRTNATRIDAHYFYQGIWAFRRIVTARPTRHVDVGSQVDLVGYLSVMLPVTFIDIRPLSVRLDRLDCLRASILNLPCQAGTVESLSSLHVIEHVGLGRYGDRLDPSGTKKACAELSRILAKGGYLYLSVPVGRPRTCYNAHRVHAPEKIIDFCKTLDLVEFSAVDDVGQYMQNITPSDVEAADYACGLFRFTKR